MLDEAWTLSPSVAIRPEPFGALAYHFGTRKLTFLKRTDLVALVQTLGAHPDIRSAMAAAAIPESHHAAFLQALEGLARTDMIRPRAAGAAA